MTRCLNCGAERTSDRCEACGLGSAAAEQALRHTLLRRLAIFLIGAIGFFVPVGLYPPLELDGISIFIGVVFFLTIGLAVLVERRAMRRAEVEVFKRIFFGLVPLPWLVGALLFINGGLGRVPPQDFDATVVSKFSMPGPMASRRLVVTSWREDRRVERVPVSHDDFGRFRVGDRIVVRIDDGLLGIPWVYGVYRP